MHQLDCGAEGRHHSLQNCNGKHGEMSKEQRPTFHMFVQDLKVGFV